jgi:hypothetical protein
MALVPDIRAADVRPSEVEAYLRSRSWRFVDEAAHGSLWTPPDDDEDAPQVFVPREPTYADYARRLREALEAVSEVERRPAAAVVRDLLTTVADIIRFGMPFTFPDASVRFGDAMVVLQRAKETMRAAAMSARRPSPIHRSGRTPRQVSEFLNDLRLGLTEPGSYVVPVIAPLGTVEPAPDEAFPRTDEPFGRFVTLRLSAALSAVETALESAREMGDLTPFATAVESGVSSNLCRAVSELTQVTGAAPADDRDRHLSIRVSWSPSRPVTETTRSAFSIARDDGTLLADAADFLKRAEARPRVTLIGQVVRLEREPDEPDGTIGVRGRVDDDREVRILSVPLSPHEYERALHAHDLRLEVTCRGVLERQGTRWRLSSPVEFHAPEALFDERPDR